jgi:hypothetical protein
MPSVFRRRLARTAAPLLLLALCSAPVLTGT